MLGHLEMLMTSILADDQKAIAELDMLPLAERTLLLETFNDTKADYPKDKTIADLFEEQVAKTPNNIAIVFDPDDNRDKIELTYKQLNQQANKLAHYLQQKYDTKGDDIIALQLQRSEWMIIAILGVLKAGAAYLPIAPDAPKNRVAYMLKDSKAKTLLTDTVTINIAQEFDIAVENVQTIKYGRTNRNPKSNIRNATNLAYVIYTSGSTGMPKGVSIHSAALINYISWTNNCYFDNNTKEALPLYTSIEFDMSVTTLFSPLLRGAAIHIVNQGEVTSHLKQLFAVDSGITVLKMTPSHIELLKALNLTATKIEKVIVGGEALYLNQIETLLSLNCSKRLSKHTKIYFLFEF